MMPNASNKWGAIQNGRAHRFFSFTRRNRRYAPLAIAALESVSMIQTDRIFKGIAAVRPVRKKKRLFCTENTVARIA